MDFKAALLKSQPNAAAASVFKPTAGDASATGKKQLDAHKPASFIASGDEGGNNVAKVCGYYLTFHLATLKTTDFGPSSVRATVLGGVTSA
jgi:hypothetical protein